MDWARARTNMVEGQVRPNRVTDPRIIEAMLAIPREALVPPSRRALAYADALVPLAAGRALLEPMVSARLVQEAAPREGERALVLPGLGAYGALVLERLGLSVTVLERPELADQARRLFGAAGMPLTVVAGELDKGHAAAAPYDLILVEAAVPFLPEAWGAQLAEGGRLLAIVGDRAPRLAVRAIRTGPSLTSTGLFDAAAPLVDDFGATAGFSL
ncbi:MAG: protein-L-isoaspartate O-methyltransferase [Acetobacteraceae bacterium]|nr:protein-L-isoaspartate O-methyltransferase [Acetobacteraceae bacterium]